MAALPEAADQAGRDPELPAWVRAWVEADSPRPWPTSLSQDEYEMVLDLAAPGKDFAACQQMRMKRVRGPTPVSGPSSWTSPGAHRGR